eukprot:scaffold1747_cov108-Isochrysis_galbana.AAC.11
MGVSGLADASCSITGALIAPSPIVSSILVSSASSVLGVCAREMARTAARAGSARWPCPLVMSACCRLRSESSARYNSFLLPLLVDRFSRIPTSTPATSARETTGGDETSSTSRSRQPRAMARWLAGSVARLSRAVSASHSSSGCRRHQTAPSPSVLCSRLTMADVAPASSSPRHQRLPLIASSATRRHPSFCSAGEA